MKEELVGTIMRNLAESVRVSIVDQGMGPAVDLRIWATPRSSGDEAGLHPTERGMTLQPDQAQELALLLVTAGQMITMQGAEHAGNKG